jgi:hypothetical protein
MEIKQSFSDRRVMVDEGDGVSRCGRCNWEIVGDECQNCGTLFNGVVDHEHDDGETGDESDEDEFHINVTPLGVRVAFESEEEGSILESVINSPEEEEINHIEMIHAVRMELGIPYPVYTGDGEELEELHTTSSLSRR